jgi:hypothetical protein
MIAYESYNKSHSKTSAMFKVSHSILVCSRSRSLEYQVFIGELRFIRRRCIVSQHLKIDIRSIHFLERVRLRVEGWLVY